jgi:translation initiation factor 2 beta subunit (eIF-2beta)/eIF-5
MRVEDGIGARLEAPALELAIHGQATLVDNFQVLPQDLAHGHDTIKRFKSVRMVMKPQTLPVLCHHHSRPTARADHPTVSEDVMQSLRILPFDPNHLVCQLVRHHERQRSQDKVI